MRTKASPQARPAPRPALAAHAAYTGRPLVVLGFLGTSLDVGYRAERWDRWRPTVALCAHEELVVSRLELLRDLGSERLAEVVTQDLAAISPETEVRQHVLPLADPWNVEEVYTQLHDFARSYPFAPEREDYLVHITTGTHVAQICLFLLTESRHLPARLLQTSPPTKRQPADPHGSYAIVDLDLSRYDLIASRFSRERDEGLSVLKAGIATRNAAFNRLIEQIERVALASRAPMLLTGPTGAGKSQLARRIYQIKKARNQVSGPLVEVNCATLRGDGAMSALFGHTRGAFTGAVKDRPGLLRAAHEGLLFLDEIGELGLDEQAMLLRAIEERSFLPVGADREVTSDFQLLAGTNRDLTECVQNGRFREDLLARIDLWHFHLPGIRERLEDLEPNLDFELERAAQTTGKRVTIAREARTKFLRFATSKEALWPGNFRDFGGCVLRMATLAPGGRIDLATVDDELARLRRAWRTRQEKSTTMDVVFEALGAERGAAMDRFERVQLATVIEACRASDSLSAAGRLLFAGSRAQKQNPNDADRLRKYLARHGLDFAAVAGAGRAG